MEKKYEVAKGHSFTGNKKSYKEGDEITADAFKGKDGAKHFQAFVKNGSIVESKPGSEKEKADDDEGGDGDIQTTLTRAELETLALEFMPADAIAKLDDAKLKKVLKKKGKIG